MEFLLARFPVFPPSRFPVFPFSRFLILAVVATLLITTTSIRPGSSDIPDPNLKECHPRNATTPCWSTHHTAGDVTSKTSGPAWQRDITDLTGIQHDCSFGPVLILWGNQP